MKQALLKAPSFVALPVSVVVSAKVDDVFPRNVSGASRRCKHLALHHGFYFARNLNEKLFPNAAWARVLVSGLEKVLTRLAINPFSN
jgi:hypothetical protein